MWRLGVVAVCGCNQILGLGSTRPFDAPSQIDAQYFDAPIDAPFACPVAGVTPSFSPQLHQDFMQSCSSYTISTTGRAAGDCQTGDMTNNFVGVGPVDQPLVPVAGTPQVVGGSGDFIGGVWIVPEGDILIVGGYLQRTTRFLQFQHQPDDSWLPIADLGIVPNSTNFMLSGVTTGPNRHLIRYTASELDEEVDDGTNTWATQLPPITDAQLGVTTHGYPHLSADGLRLIFLGSPAGVNSPQALYYTDRATMSDPFRPAVLLPGVPLDVGAFMDDACARVYVSGLGSMFFAQRL